MKRHLKTAALALAIGTAIAALGPASPILAHHGWSSFDTRHAYYVSGTVSYVRWGNPHGEVHLKIVKTDVPSDLADRQLPPGADEEIGQATVASARPYKGEREELHLVLAGPSWMERWGMERPLKVGETIEVLGFLQSAEGEDLRPVMFWLTDGQGVWQQLTAFPEAPEPAPKN